MQIATRPARPRQPTPLPVSTLAAPECPAVIERELAFSIGSRRLLRCGCFVAYAVQPDSAPATLRELGRVRELSFRAAGEGTGRPRDLDAFDDDYEQIVLWDAQRRQIAGGYRLGHVATLRDRRGIAGLYTHTLFELGAAFVDSVSPGFELGRSFLTPDYQRKGTSLFALWKAIGARILDTLDVRWLFGPVSISADYRDDSRALIDAWLHAHALDQVRHGTARPRRPLRVQAIADVRGLADPDDLDAAIRHIESGARGVPVLLRHYLGLGGRLVATSVDPAFGNTLDALVCVDLLALPEASARRYLGVDGSADLRAALAGAVRCEVDHGAREGRPRRAEVTLPARARIPASS